MPLKEKHWNWIKISIYIVAGIFLCGILKLILQIFNGTGPISTGIGKILGGGANLVNGVVNGCQTQPDCSKGSNVDKNSCQNLTNCSFEPITGKDGKPANICISSNGTPPGGGINTMGCALGIGFLAWLAASILAPIAGFFIRMFGKKNETIDDISEVTGEGRDQLTYEAMENSRKLTEEALNEYKSQNEEGGEPDEATQSGMAEMVTSMHVAHALIDLIETNPQDSAMQKHAMERLAAEQDSIHKRLTEDNEKTEKQVNDMSDSAHDITGMDNVAPKMIRSTIINATKHKIEMSENLKNYLKKYTIKLGIDLSHEHRALIGMDAVPPLMNDEGHCWTTNWGPTSATGTRGNCKTVDESLMVSQVQAYNKDFVPSGRCFLCQNSATRGTDGKFTNNPEVFPVDQSSDITGGVYTTDCVKNEYNCLDIKGKDGTLHPWSDIKDCFSHGNGICNSSGTSICTSESNLATFSACKSCVSGTIPDSYTPPKTCGPGPYHCVETTDQNTGITRTCEINKTTNVGDNLATCQSKCSKVETVVDCDQDPYGGDWCGVCNTYIWDGGYDCDTICKNIGRTEYLKGRGNPQETDPAARASTMIINGVQKKWDSGTNCHYGSCSCFPKDSIY